MVIEILWNTTYINFILPAKARFRQNLKKHDNDVASI